MDDRELAARVLEHTDVDRAVQLSQEVSRIPSVLGEEGPLAKFLGDVMKESGFEAVELQPVLPDRPNATGEVSFGLGPRVVLTGHLDTKPVSHGWSAAEPFSGALLGGAVYGHGIMDMKAALACEIVAIEALARSGLPLSGTLAMSAVSDHMGDQAGAVAYFGAHPADLSVLGELTDNQVCLGHRGRFYFDVTVLGKSAHSCHKHLAVNANTLAAHVVLSLDASRYEPELPDDVRELFGPETYVVPGRIARPGLPIFVSASGRRTLELAGGIADGVILLVGLFTDSISWALKHIDRGAAAAGRPRPHTALFACGAISDDGPAAPAAARSIAAWFIQTAPHLCRLAGLDPDIVDAVRASYADGEFQEAEATAGMLPDSFVRRMALAGDEQEASDRIREALAAGVDSVHVFPLGADRMATVGAFAGVMKSSAQPAGRQL